MQSWKSSGTTFGPDQVRFVSLFENIMKCLGSNEDAVSDHDPETDSMTLSRSLRMRLLHRLSLKERKPSSDDYPEFGTEWLMPAFPADYIDPVAIY